MISLLPNVIFPKVTDITADYLHTQGIELLMLDFDNTMLPYTINKPTQALLQWLEKMKKSGIRICIVSNSKKQRVPQFGKRYGVDVITHAKKPFPRGIRRCLVRYKLPPEKTALCGDQIFTDVLGARSCGVRSILVKSIHNHNIWLKLRHFFEIPFILMAHSRRIENEKS